jgi:putative ABC transport system ATP-binding protein
MRDKLLVDMAGVIKEREKGGVRFSLRVPRFEVHTGRFILISGPSGCGKSTLLDLLGLVLTPSRAQVFRLRAPGGDWLPVMGLDEARSAGLRAGLIGYILQSGGLLPFLKVRDNILLTRRIKGLPAEPEHALRLAQRLDIEQQLNKKPAHLSGGQRQRAAIARALAHEPALVLADEPTAAVDRNTAREICAQLAELCKLRGTAVVLVSHDSELYKPVADTCYGFELERSSPKEIVSTLVLQENGNRP